MSNRFSDACKAPLISIFSILPAKEMTNKHPEPARKTRSNKQREPLISANQRRPSNNNFFWQDNVLCDVKGKSLKKCAVKSLYLLKSEVGTESKMEDVLRHVPGSWTNRQKRRYTALENDENQNVIVSHKDARIHTAFQALFPRLSGCLNHGHCNQCLVINVFFYTDQNVVLIVELN